MRQFLAVCLAVSVSEAALAEAPAGPAEGIPELRPLARFAGVWDTQMTLTLAGLPNGKAAVKGSCTAEWIHGGRFLRQNWGYDAGDGLPAGSGSTMMTYDPEAKVYRNWMFFSSGTVLESEGTWDEKAATFTWTGRGPTKSVTTAKFPADGTERWSLVDRDKDGKVVREAVGTNTPKK